LAISSFLIGSSLITIWEFVNSASLPTANMPSVETGWTAVMWVCLSNSVSKSGQYFEIILPRAK
jgi:hypothetical protein